MSIVDALLANPGTYIGLDHDPSESDGSTSAARIVVTPLPGGGSVTVDYETFNPALVDRVRPHAEHVIIGRTHGGGAILVSGHVHADSVAVLREGPTGVFSMGDEPSAFPVQVTIEVPKAGQLVYSWAYGAPGEEPIPRDRAELTLVT